MSKPLADILRRWGEPWRESSKTKLETGVHRLTEGVKVGGSGVIKPSDGFPTSQGCGKGANHPTLSGEFSEAHRGGGNGFMLCSYARLRRSRAAEAANIVSSPVLGSGIALTVITWFAITHCSGGWLLQQSSKAVG